ncbi:putative SIGNAL PEPTIDE protein [Sinorhizobium sojae CCBAU 05684]|uniref:Putative SIGNAL PEPTIDE protein n=1 Tax=Sinorhizobium sojae CCBAU 05684 TaxID=716928 RepID=A0A249PDD1_9HYPH|nr:putative SIGNAL PEPTIDE protein [Sinorhizobium sojae CCBAU 05684]
MDTMPTGSIYVDPALMGPVYVRPAPIYNLTPSEIRERHLNEYHAGGEGDYYQGIIPPAPVP